MNPLGYDEAIHQIDYSFSSGVLVMPVQGPPGTPARLVNVHAPYGLKTVPWRARRTNSQPLLPSPAPQNSNEVLMGASIKPTVPTRTSESGVQYMVEGNYVFAMALPLVPGIDSFPMGQCIADPTANSAAQATYLITASWFNTTILPAQTPSTGSSFPTAVPIKDRSGIKPS